MTSSRRVRKLRTKAKQAAQSQVQGSKKAVGYVRVSTDEQKTNGYGLKAQEAAIRAFAASQGYELVDVIAESGISGTIEPEKRPGFQCVLKMAEAGRFSILLVWRFDRLSRTLTHSVTTANGLREKYGVVLRSVTEPIDTATPMGEMLFAVLAGFAGEERRTITRRTQGGKESKAREGGYAGGRVPLGYRPDQKGGLEIDDAEAATVRRIFTLRKKSKSLHGIAAILNEERVPTKRGGKWYAATVRYILDNPKYRGYVEYLFRWEGESYVLKKASHEAIVPKVQRAA